MQRFDAASRGPLGSLIILIHHRAQSLVSLGAAIIILLSSFGPFMQQNLSHPVHPTMYMSTTASAYAPQLRGIFFYSRQPRNLHRKVQQKYPRQRIRWHLQRKASVARASVSLLTAHGAIVPGMSSRHSVYVAGALIWPTLLYSIASCPLGWKLSIELVSFLFLGMSCQSSALQIHYRNTAQS